MHYEIILKISAAKKGYFALINLYLFELSTPCSCIWLRNVVGDKRRRREIANRRKESTPPNLWSYLRKWRIPNKNK
ncbi:Reverse transcriptase domain-containing protein, partial [Aphis craccivora]